MDHLTKLFRLMQLTRSQPQYGYVLTGMHTHELSNLAEHHYLVTFIAHRLVSVLNQKGAKLDMAKVLEICLFHDLGELFGGDISLPYQIANPKAKKLAKAFEAENLKFINSFLKEDSKDFAELMAHIAEPKSDEALVAKIADYLEASHFLFHNKKAPKNFVRMMSGQLAKFAGKIKDPVAKRELSKFIRGWAKADHSKTVLDDFDYI